MSFILSLASLSLGSHLAESHFLLQMHKAARIVLETLLEQKIDTCDAAFHPPRTFYRNP